MLIKGYMIQDKNYSAEPGTRIFYKDDTIEPGNTFMRVFLYALLIIEKVSSNKQHHIFY